MTTAPTLPPITLSFAALPDQAAEIAKQQGIAIPLSQQAETFLRTVWSAMPAGELVGLVGADEYSKQGGIRATSTPEWFWWGEELAPVLTWAEEHNNKRFQLAGQGSIYWNAASRKSSVLERYHARGKHSELSVITSFFCDLDTSKRGYSLAEGMKVLLSMPLKPSVIVFSGGGLQAVHILNEPWSIPNEAAVLEYKDYSLALYKPTFEAAGLKLDTSVHEAGREMRLPGFVNRKPQRNTFARILYWHPEITYTPAEIRARVALPAPKPKLAPIVLVSSALPTGTYAVGQDFVHYLIEGNTPPERHPTLLKLALQAARAGIPAELFVHRVRPVAERWFEGEQHRAYGELDSAVNWAYTRDSNDREDAGYTNWLITLTDSATGSGFAQADPVSTELHRDKTITLDVKQVSNPDPDDQSDDDPAQSIEAVRAEQRDLLARYLVAKTRGMGTYMLMRTSPGAGKTYTTLRAGEDTAQTLKQTGDDEKGHVAMLTLFKDDERAWQERVLEHGGTPNLYGYLVARNGDPNSAGYCALHKQAEQVASKHYNVVATLCSRCPLKTQCDEQWYLSQFKRMQTEPILLARHQHGMIQELMRYRKLIIFDESPLEIVAGAIRVTPDDLAWRSDSVSVFIEDQYPAELTLLKAWVKALHDVVVLNTVLPSHQHPTHEHVRLGGRWLFERLAHELSGMGGTATLAKLAALSPEFVQEVSKGKLQDTDPQSVQNLPVNWLFQAWLIFQHEYAHRYQRNATRWNSRLIVWANELRIHPMGAFNYQQNTKVVITDATGLPELYGKAFTYTKQAQGTQTRLPRQALVYEGKLSHKSRVLQFTGSDNTKTAIKGKRAGSAKTEKITLATTNGEIEFDPTEFAPDPDSVARIKALILELAKRHERSLLVVTYQEFALKLRAWNKQANVLDEKHIQWYRALRGRNDYKNLNAVLLIGTPRIPHMDLLALAQVWHWQDDLPIDETLLLRSEPYAGYVGDDGKGRGYQYIGFADERVNSLYIGMIAAEMRQCYERIRPNASLDSDGKHIEKHVYIASAFPCADKVDLLMNWATWWVDHVGLTYYEAQIAAGKTVYQTDYTEHVIARTKCVYNTAKASFERIHGMMTGSGKAEHAGRKKPQKQIVLEWLAADPIRTKLSSRVIAKELGVRQPTAADALKEFKG